MSRKKLYGNLQVFYDYHKHKLDSLKLVKKGIISQEFWIKYNPEFTVWYSNDTVSVLSHNDLIIIGDYLYFDNRIKQVIRTKKIHNYTFKDDKN